MKRIATELEQADHGPSGPGIRGMSVHYCGRQNSLGGPLMTRIGLSLGIALVALVPLCATAEDHHNVVQADSFKWAAGPPSLPKGAAIALLFGDPTKEGPYGYRIKVPSGYTGPAHTHPTDANITVISGTFIIGVGDKLEPNKGQAVKAGGYFHMPQAMQHYMSFPEETIFQAKDILKKSGNATVGRLKPLIFHD